MTDEEIAAGLRTVTDRVRAEAKKKPGRAYMPAPLTDAVPPKPHQDADTDTEGDHE
jgi:hypothetical protein